MTRTDDRAVTTTTVATTRPTNPRRRCPVHQDYRELEVDQLLEKHETTYNDFVSVHIKVHGLNDGKATTWTRQLKEYLELMSPQVGFRRA